MPNVETLVRDRLSEDPRPLAGYLTLLATYGGLTTGATLALRRWKRTPEPLTIKNLLLMGLATAHLSRVLTKDSVLAPLRAPFTRYEEAIGEGESQEGVVGHGVRHAAGELFTCPFCIAQWIATGLVCGSMVAPNLTTGVVSVSAIARTSDFAQLLYGMARAQQS